MKHLEIEYKWQANVPRTFGRASAMVKQMSAEVKEKSLRMEDTYLDHANGDLAKQKIALRVRKINDRWEATFKTRTQVKNGKAVRREETLSLPQVKNVAQALTFLAQKKSWKGINLRGLTARFVLKNKRYIYVFNYDGATLEMALDDVTLYVLGRQVKFREIEAELKHGPAQALDRFARLFTQQTKLKRAEISKVKTAETFLKFWQK